MRNVNLRLNGLAYLTPFSIQIRRKMISITKQMHAKEKKYEISDIFAFWMYMSSLHSHQSSPADEKNNNEIQEVRWSTHSYSRA